MTDIKQDPITGKDVISNVCETCQTRYSLEEARARNMSCCGRPLKQESQRVSVPLGP